MYHNCGEDIPEKLFLDGKKNKKQKQIYLSQGQKIICEGRLEGNLVFGLLFFPFVLFWKSAQE